MLSLSPRFDLFRFELPKQFLPPVVEEKWSEVLNKEPGIITRPIDYLNESIKGITFPGISDINIEQQQHSSNSIMRSNGGAANMGKINVEPNQNNIYVGANNPLEKVLREFNVTFRMNQGLYNYFMIYETIFWRIYKPDLYVADDIFTVDIINEDGTITTRVTLDQCNIDGIDGLEFGYDKIEREVDTFNVKFKFNNIDVDIFEGLVPLNT